MSFKELKKTGESIRCKQNLGDKTFHHLVTLSWKQKSAQNTFFLTKYRNQEEAFEDRDKQESTCSINIHIRRVMNTLGG